MNAQELTNTMWAFAAMKRVRDGLLRILEARAEEIIGYKDKYISVSGHIYNSMRTHNIWVIVHSRVAGGGDDRVRVAAAPHIYTSNFTLIRDAC
jgi:hypothetical protein